MFKKKKILIIDAIGEAAISKLQDNQAYEVEYSPCLSETEILNKLNGISILVLRSSYKVTEEWLDRSNTLSVIIVAGNGTNHIPTNELEKRKIILKNIKEASVDSVAEYAICLMIMGLRKITAGIKSINQNKWNKNLLIGSDLQKKTVGLVGFGNIGKKISELLKGFNVNIVYCDLSVSEQEFDVLPLTLYELAKVSDIVSIQIPLNSSSRSLINRSFLEKMKDNAILINLSRLEVVDMDDLISVLTYNKIQEVFIDPIEKEHLNMLAKFKNLPVTFLPHFGANTREAQKRVGARLVEMIEKL